MPWTTKKENYSRSSYHSSYGAIEEYETSARVYEYEIDKDKNEQPSKLTYLEVNIDHDEFDIKVRFADKLDAEKFGASLSKNIQFDKDGPIITMRYRSEEFQKGLFLKALIKFEPRLKEKAVELSNLLKLTKLNELREMPTEKAIDFVITNQAKNYSRAEWLLLDYFDDKDISSDTISRLVNGISSENPGFKTANDMALRLATLKTHNPLMEQKTEQLASLDSDSTDEAAFFKNLEERFDFALKGSDQGITDLIFSQLCNDPWDKTPLEGVSGNFKFLVNMAKQIREERATAKLAQNPVKSSGATSAVSGSTEVTNSSVATSSSVVNQSSTPPPVTISLPKTNVSRLLGLFSKSKPASDTNESKTSPKFDK